MPVQMSHACRAVRMALAALCCLLCINSFAQTSSQTNYPTRMLTIVVPYGPGGAGDLTARIFAQKFTELTKQSAVVLNRPGAGFVNSATTVAHAKPDGYTAFLLGNGTAIAASLFKSLPYDVQRDFKHVSTISFFDLALIVNGDSPFKSVADVIAAAKAHPGKINIGTIATGSTQNLAADLFKSMAGVNMQVIPYDSTSEVVTALRSKDVQVVFEIVPSVIGQITSKAVRALAVTSATRFSGLPKVPTLAECGLKGYEASSWNGLSVPAGTPAAVVDALAKEAALVLAAPDVKRKMQMLGAEARSSTPAQMTQQVNRDMVKWKGVIQDAGIPRQ